MDEAVKAQLERNLILLYTGTKHSASAILQEQGKEMRRLEKQQVMHRMVEMAYELKEALTQNRIDDFGRILNEGWMLKRSLAGSISNPLVDTLYEQGLEAGALGGKLLGAGGAGFVLFYCPEERQADFRQQMSGYTEMPFRFENEGRKIIYIE